MEKRHKTHIEGTKIICSCGWSRDSTEYTNKTIFGGEFYRFIEIAINDHIEVFNRNLEYTNYYPGAYLVDYRWNGKMNTETEVKCKDCGQSINDLGMNTIMPDNQWYELCCYTGVGTDAILCPNCMVKRASKLPGALVTYLAIDFGIHCVDGHSKNLYHMLSNQ